MSEIPQSARFNPDRQPRVASPALGSAVLLGVVSYLLLLLAGLTAAPPALGQNGGRTGSGSIVGRVVDAESFRPLSGATVALERLVAGAEPLDDAPAHVRLGSTVTDATGEYRFEPIRPGVYRLLVHHPGYARGAVEVDLTVAPMSRLSLGLRVSPVVLPPLRVLGVGSQLYSHDTGRTDEQGDGARAAVVQARQERYLAGDVRELNHADVVEAVTLAETDIFRALQRMPGVSTRDDYTATMWTRGAPWDQTRVYFDGLPLYNPTHAGWLFSAINPDAVGSAAFHPGVRSARWGEGAAAILDLRSRSGAERDGVRGKGEISLASARVALDGGMAGGRLGWMVAARRTYVDVVSAVREIATGDEDDFIPYDFSDLVVRLDGRLGGDWSYSASGIVERDHLRGDIAGLVRRNRGEWGNRSGQVSFSMPAGPLKLRVGAGETRFGAEIRERPGRGAAEFREPTIPPLETLIAHQRLTVEAGPRSGSDAQDRWSLGYEIVRDSVGYEGFYPLVGELAVLFKQGFASQDEFRYGSRLMHNALWAEYRWSPWSPVAIQAGLRGEWGDSLTSLPGVRLSPRVAARVRTGGGSVASLGWARSYQYTQDIAPVAGPLGPQLHLTHLWALAFPGGYPAIRSDVGTVGLEQWLGSDWLLSINGYRRFVSGMQVPNPTAGRVVPDREADVAARNRARGVEIGIQRLAGQWTGSLGYAFGISKILVSDSINFVPVNMVFPASADIRHAFDATLRVQVQDGLRVGGAFTFGSGVPYTRLLLPDTAGEDRSVWLQRANEARTPSYASLDLTVDYTWKRGAREVTAFGQIRNALNRSNAVTYAGSQVCPGKSSSRGARVIGSCESGSDAEDRFETGIPRLPLFGVRMSF